MALYLLAHAAARRWLALRGHEPGEELLEMVATAILAPLPAFRAQWRLQRGRIPEIAHHFRTTQTLIHVRLAEVSGVETAVVDREFVRFRGAVAKLPRDEATIRQWAEADILPRWVRRIRPEDAPAGRSILRVE